MKISLFDLLSNVLFDWKARKSLNKLSENFVMIIQDMCGNVHGAENKSSILKASKKLMKIVKDKYKDKKSLKWILDNEKEILEKYEVLEVQTTDIEELTDTDSSSDESYTENKKSFKNLRVSLLV